MQTRCSPPHVLVGTTLVIVFLKLKYNLRGKCVRWALFPFMFSRWWFFFWLVINWRGKKILNLVEFIYGPSSFHKFYCGWHFSPFLFKKKYFFCFYFLKLILILFLFIFRLISLLSFMLFRNPIWNYNYFLIIHLIFEEVFLINLYFFNLFV